MSHYTQWVTAKFLNLEMRVAPSSDGHLRHLDAIIQNRNANPNPNPNPNPNLVLHPGATSLPFSGIT